MKADKEQITKLLKTASGQINGILKMIDEDRYCIDVSNQLLAVEAIIKKANLEIIKAHLNSCVRESFSGGNSEEKINEVLDIVTKISKIG